MSNDHGSSGEISHAQHGQGHIPVLLCEVIDFLALHSGDDVMDCTFGGGGYTRAILAATQPNGRVLAIDHDPDAILRGQTLQGILSEKSRLILAHGNFEDIASIAAEHQVHDVAAIVADLGTSSFQLDAPHRGFSFSRAGDLDMRFDRSSARPTAAQLIATRSVDDLEHIVRIFGEERHARRIAQTMVTRRRHHPITTTTELADLIQSIVPRRGRIHPATRTFQALRIAVNDELGVLTRAIPVLESLVRPGGRIAIVSFHSLEDRIVKHAFRAAALRGWGRMITAKPIIPSDAELRENPRSRSAKLRVIERR